ncbi:FAD-binding oxidoreductase [Echinicola sediminis]
MQTTTSSLHIIQEKILQEFTSSIRGKVITLGHEEYESSRQVYNAMIDKHPAMIVKCRDVADIISTIHFAREQSLDTAIRGGGHNAGGLGVVENGLVIDLSLMKGIRIDPLKNTVRAEAGCLLGDIDHATQHFRKAVPTGILSTTGISGLTLGGGIGHLSRAYGLSIDNLIEADVVLADGTLVTASEVSHPDLFWAIRGGGGNFGVITSFLFQLHEAGTVNAGPMLWHLEDAEVIMPAYRDFILSAANNNYCYFAFLTVPPVPMFPEHLHLKKMCGMVWCNLGEQANSDKATNKFRELKTPAFEHVGPMPYANLQSVFDALYPKGLQWYWKADFLNELSDEAIAKNIQHAHLLPTPHSTVHFYPINGACHKKSDQDTAWGYRNANWAQVIVGVDPDPANKGKISTWAKNYWDAIHPYSAGGAYVNFMMEEGEDRVKASYGQNYERLVAIKTKYDPNNFFHVNQNIKPNGR